MICSLAYLLYFTELPNPMVKNVVSAFLFFFCSCVSANPVAKTSEELCVNAHLRLWELTPWIEEGNKKKNYIEKSRNYKKFKFLYRKEYYEFYDSKKINTKKKLQAEYEADSWVRCMKK